MRNRQVMRFGAMALLYFALLMALTPAGFYPPLFRAGANLLFGSAGSGRIAKFEAFDDPKQVFDTKMSVGVEVEGRPAFASSLGVNSVRQGYVPTAVLLALVLATPLAWPRRWRVLLVGFLFVQGFVALRVGTALFYGFSRVGLGERRLLEVPSYVAWCLRRADQVFAGDLHMTYIVPLLIWMVVALRPSELAAVWRGERADTVEPEEARPGLNRRCPCGSGRKYKHCCGKHRRKETGAA